MNKSCAPLLAFVLGACVLPSSCAGGASMLGGVTSSLAALGTEAAGAKSGLGSLLGSLPSLFRGGSVNPESLRGTLASLTGVEGLLKGLDAKSGGALQALTKHTDALRQEVAKAPTEDGRRATSEKLSALEALTKNLSTQTQATQSAAGGVVAGIKDLTGMLSGAPGQDTLQKGMALLGKLQTDGQGALASFDGLGKIVDQVSAFLKR